MKVTTHDHVPPGSPEGHRRCKLEVSDDGNGKRSTRLGCECGRWFETHAGFVEHHNQQARLLLSVLK